MKSHHFQESEQPNTPFLSDLHTRPALRASPQTERAHTSCTVQAFHEHNGRAGVTHWSLQSRLANYGGIQYRKDPVLCIPSCVETDWGVEGKMWCQPCPVQLSRSWERRREGAKRNQHRAPCSLPSSVLIGAEPASAIAGSLLCWVGPSPRRAEQTWARLANTITSISASPRSLSPVLVL